MSLSWTNCTSFYGVIVRENMLCCYVKSLVQGERSLSHVKRMAKCTMTWTSCNEIWRWQYFLCNAIDVNAQASRTYLVIGSGLSVVSWYMHQTCVTIQIITACSASAYSKRISPGKLPGLAHSIQTSAKQSPVQTLSSSNIYLLTYPLQLPECTLFLMLVSCMPWSYRKTSIACLPALS